jgi:enterochelin esterase-like enzyme
MKRILLSLFLTLASLVRSQAGAGAPGVVSPEVHPDRTVTFRIAAPKAADVTITCDWVDGAQKLTNADNGTWSVTLGPLPPSSYIYSFNVDGVATVDPVNPRIKLRARGSANFVVVPSESPGVQEVRDVPHGAVEAVWQKSSVLGGETRRFLVYTPPGYTQDTARHYPVLLLLHGSNDTADGWVNVGNVNFIADNLIAEKKMVPMVLVIPNFYPVASASSSQRGGGGGGAGNTTFYKYLVEEVLPMVESKYRIAAGRENHAVAGMSLGANQSFDLFFSHFDLFSSVGALCPSTYGQLESAHADFLADSKGNNAKIGVLWIGCGRQDPGHFNGAQAAAAVLEAHQINHIWHPTEGMHNYAIWRDYLVEFLPLLFQPASATAPPAAR